MISTGGHIDQKLLKERLRTNVYCKILYMPVLWKLIIIPIQFNLVVDDFVVKFQGK